MSWKAMEVSMSKTRRGKYIDNRICHKGKCKGDMRFNLRGKGKIPCFSYLCEGNHFRFIEERYKLNLRNSLLFAEIFNATFLFGLNDPFKPFAKLRFFYFTPNI